MSKTELVKFFFHSKPEKLSINGILLTYLNQNRANIIKKSELILHSLSAFWLPFAYKSCTDISEEEIQKIAISSIYRLKSHIQLLENSFDLDTYYSNLSVQTDKNDRLDEQLYESEYVETLEELINIDTFCDEIKR